MKTHYAAAIAFSLIYLYFAVQMTSAGHGTTIFLAPFTPLGLPWLLFIAAFVALGWIPKPGTEYAFVFLMVAHYVLVIAMFTYMWNDTLPGTERMFRLHPLWVVGAISAYVFPHVYVWANFSQSIRNPK
jgi:hypothetical protein